MHTRNSVVNSESIAIVLAGNFQNEFMTSEQETSLDGLIKKLDDTFHFEKIIPHRDASSTAFPGKNLLEGLKDVWREYNKQTKAEAWNFTRYYTSIPGQLH